MTLKSAGSVANSVDPGQMSHSAVSDQGLNCLLRAVCAKTKGYCSTVKGGAVELVTM